MISIAFYITFIFFVVLNATYSLPLNMSESIVSIVGDNEVDITEYPYQALVRIHKGQFYKFCGGSIIGRMYILTAAHCVEGKNESQLFVKIGSSYVRSGGELYSVSKKFMHHKYLHNSSTIDHDVAVLKTSVKMSIDGKYTKIIKMASFTSSVSPEKNIVVTGWGHIKEGGPISEVLRVVSVPVVSLKYCKKAYEDAKLLITDQMFCAGLNAGGNDSCQGDSGGPAVDEDSHVQYGIVSFGHGCGLKGFPGVYTSIPAVRDWIHKVSGI